VPPEHPIRVVVADDLRRSRLTVFFRLFISIPHLFWAAIFAQVVFLAVLAQWFVLLFTGKPSAGIHHFVARFFRYATWLEAYVALTANPFPPFFLIADERTTYPVDIELPGPEPQSRWKTFFRFPLAIPALIVAGALTGGGFGSSNSVRSGTLLTAAFLGWFAALFVGRMPRGLRDLGAWSIGYGAQLGGYLFLLTDRYPHTSPRCHFVIEGTDPRPLPEPPARLVVTDDLRRSRLTTFFRLPLLAPHIVWTILWGVVAFVFAFVNWFCALALGRSPRFFARFLSAFVRYQTHLHSFAYLVGNPFPGFVGKLGTYPVDLELDPYARQSRWSVLGRLILAVPALLIAGSASAVLFTIAFLGWFVALIQGRMPEGFRDAGAWGIGYNAQLWTYLFLLSGRYPFSGPPLTPRATVPVQPAAPLVPQLAPQPAVPTSWM
jgi:hypothetical protein